MILEVAQLYVKPGQEETFEAAMREAQHIIMKAKGYRSHTLHRCVETPSKYVLLVQWETVDNHMIDFRQSADYQEWKQRLHRFYDSFVVEHYEAVKLD